MHRISVLYTLLRFHTVHSISAQFSADDSIGTGQVNVSVAGKCYTTAGKDVLLVESLYQFGKFVFSHLNWLKSDLFS